MSTRTRRPHLYPTRKWWATQISATTALATAWVSAGHWNKPLTLAAIGVVSQAAVVYLVPNADPAPRPETGAHPGPGTRSGLRSGTGSGTGARAQGALT